MVARGEWDPRDDKRLVRALLDGGAREEHQADWGGAVEGRTEAQVRAGGLCMGGRAWV
jgi:hypothetical protein